MYDKHLDYFLSVADCGSFSKAAEKAFISPNAVIKQINLLETDLNVTLFVRTKHGVSLTEAGKSLYRDAQKIIHWSNKAVKRAQTIEKSESHELRIGTSLLRPCKTILDLWTVVSQNFPNLRLQIIPFDDTYDNWIKILKNIGKDIDMIACVYPSTLYHQKCQVLTLTWYPVYCAVPRNHPLSAKTKLRISDLYGETLMIVERGDTSYIDAVRDELEKNHPQIHLMDVPSYDIKVFNQCETSNSIMLTVSIWADLHPSLVTLPCEWDYTIPYGILYSSQPSKSVQAFIDAIKTTYD